MALMASSGQDAKNSKSWQEAFNYPVATTRQIEKQLRNDIAANKERVRTLVGSVVPFSVGSLTWLIRPRQGELP